MLRLTEKTLADHREDGEVSSYCGQFVYHSANLPHVAALGSVHSKMKPIRTHFPPGLPFDERVTPEVHGER